MTVAATTRKAGPYTGNGATTAFPFGFKVFAASEVVVTQTDLAGAETTLALTTNYTVALNADQDANPGGTVNMLVAPANGYLLTLTSNVALSQSVTLTNGGSFYPSVISAALDRVTILAQQLAEQVGRAVKVSVSSSSTPDQIISSINTAASTATAAASAASGSATAAAGSATAASGSATAAAASAAALPNVSGGANTVPVINDTATNWLFKTAAQFLTFLGGNTANGPVVLNGAGKLPAVDGSQLTGISTVSFKNRIINGGGVINQRGGIALSATANTSYACDRITIQAAGGTGLGGNTAVAGPGMPTTSGYIAGASGCNWTTATMKAQTRIEFKDTIDLNSQTITISGKVYHTIGSTRTMQVVLSCPTTTADDFSALTTIGTSATFQAADSTYVSFSYTLALGASDASKGLHISVEDTATSTVTGKNFYIGDLQLEKGASATVFEHRPVAVELALCQRYYQKTYDSGVVPGSASTTGMAGVVVNGTAGTNYSQVSLSSLMRAAPTVNIYDGAGNANAFSKYQSGAWTHNITSSISAANIGVASFSVSYTGNLFTVGVPHAIHYTASAEL